VHCSKSTKNPLGLAETWLDSTRSVWTPLDSRVWLDWIGLDAVGVYAPLGWVEVYLCSFLEPSALDGGGGSAPRPGRLYPRGKTRYPLYTRLGGPQGRSGRAENLVPTGIRSRTLWPLVSHCNDCSTRPTHQKYTLSIIWLASKTRAKRQIVSCKVKKAL